MLFLILKLSLVVLFLVFYEPSSCYALKDFLLESSLDQ